MKVLLDSNILIDYLHDIPQAEEALLGVDSGAISVISYIELLAGVRSDYEEATFQVLVAGLRIVPVTIAIAERAASLRRRTRLKLPDAVILATAEVESLVLLMRNTKDYSETHPLVGVPYRL